MMKQLLMVILLASPLGVQADDAPAPQTNIVHRPPFQPIWAARMAHPLPPLQIPFLPKEPQPPDFTVRFDDLVVGQPPPGWLAGATGAGAPHWTVEQDPTAPSRPNVLKQSGAAKYPWCVKQDTLLTNGFVEVRFKPVAGRENQAGGVIWRWKDGDDYYVVRADALENNLRAFHVVKGNNVPFAGVDTKITAGEWHWLRVMFQDSHLQVWFDGNRQFDADDATIAGGGLVGVSTKGDSVTLFDNFDDGQH